MAHSALFGLSLKLVSSSVWWKCRQPHEIVFSTVTDTQSSRDRSLFLGSEEADHAGGHGRHVL